MKRYTKQAVIKNGMAIFISDKIDLRTNLLLETKDIYNKCHSMHRVLTIEHIYAPNNRALEPGKTQTELKGETALQ